MSDQSANMMSSEEYARSMQVNREKNSQSNTNSNQGNRTYVGMSVAEQLRQLEIAQRLAMINHSVTVGAVTPMNEEEIVNFRPDPISASQLSVSQYQPQPKPAQPKLTLDQALDNLSKLKSSLLAR